METTYGGTAAQASVQDALTELSPSFYNFGAVDLRYLKEYAQLQQVLPLLLGFPAVGLLAVHASRVFFRLSGPNPPELPNSLFIQLFPAVLVMAFFVALATLPALGGRMSPESLRRE